MSVSLILIFLPNVTVLFLVFGHFISVVLLQFGQSHEQLVPPLHPGRQMLRVFGNQLTHLLWTERRETCEKKIIVEHFKVGLQQKKKVSLLIHLMIVGLVYERSENVHRPNMTS